MKTPEEIADAALDAYAEILYPEEEREFHRNLDAGNWRSLIIDAIESDRAQRIPRGAAQYIVDELVDDLAPSEAVDMILALFGGEDPRVARIAELKAEWEEATGHSADDYILSEDDWRFGLTQFDAAQIVRLIEEVAQ